MFPQLIAGPIVRYSTISAEINRRSISMHDLAEGSFRFLVGLGKKVILANQLGELSAAFLDGDFASLSTGGAWIGILAYTMQIYFDFSGYSDMAIGMGRCMGFHFDENFNYPYVTRTITEFWRRWHDIALYDVCTNRCAVLFTAFDLPAGIRRTGSAGDTGECE